MKLRYDPKADRLRLVIPQGEQPMRVFWLNRNQALNAVAMMTVALRKLGLEPEVVEPLKSPPARPQKDPQIDGVVPEALDAVRLRQKADRTQMLLVQGDKAFTLGLKPEALKRLLDVLSLQCERAGWDLAAGLDRLRALAQARVAIAKNKMKPNA